MALNIADLFEHAVDAFPDRLAVTCGDEERTYAQLEERTNRLAHHLASRGVVPGSHVGVYGRNSMDLVETIIAIYKLRAVFININYRYTADELYYIFDNADLVALVHQQRFTPLVQEVLPRCPLLKHVVVIEDGSGETYSDVEYEAALAASSPERDFEPRSDDDIYIHQANIQYLWDAPWLGDTKLTLGKFSTLIGYEVAQAAYNQLKDRLTAKYPLLP